MKREKVNITFLQNRYEMIERVGLVATSKQTMKVLSVTYSAAPFVGLTSASAWAQNPSGTWQGTPKDGSE